MHKTKYNAISQFKFHTFLNLNKLFGVRQLKKVTTTREPGTSTITRIATAERLETTTGKGCAFSRQDNWSLIAIVSTVIMARASY